MRVIVFGATGMVGQGVLRECLRDPGVLGVLTVGRSATGQLHTKLREIAHRDMGNLGALAGEFVGYDACFYCLGVSSVGMTERAYRRVTCEMPVAAATLLVSQNPRMTFVYVSGQGADSSGTSRIMWARVKGEAENALRALPFAAVFVFRPGFIQPMHGVTSRTALYRWLYRAAAPLYPVWKALLPAYVTSTEQIGRAMIEAARHGAARTVLENVDINTLADHAR